MDKVDGKELWRMIPPEEKFAMMAVAQARGILACIIAFVSASTLAVALQMGWIMWGSLITMPFAFQFAAGRVWRELRPRAMLEYLAARSAARRYAYSANSKELHLYLIFRGKAEKLFEGQADSVLQSMEATIENTKESEVWITLFTDALVLMTERVGGAEAIFAHQINDKVEVTGSTPDDSGEYSASREVIVSFDDKRGNAMRYKLTSHCPAALLVFEKQYAALRNRLLQKQSSVEAEARPDPFADEPEPPMEDSF